MSNNCQMSDFYGLIAVGELSQFSAESQVIMSITQINPLTVDLPYYDDSDVDDEDLVEEC